MGRVVVTPTVLSDVHAALESFGFNVHVSVRIQDRSYEGVSFDEIALLPLHERERISSINLVATSNYARLDLTFDKTSEARFTAIGDDDRLLAPVISAINDKLDGLATFQSIADLVGLGASLTVMLILLSPIVLAVIEHGVNPTVLDDNHAVGPGLAVVVFVVALLVGVSTLAWDAGAMCRFSWAGVSQKHSSRLSTVAPQVVRYFVIAIWTIVAAVLAQVIGSYLWERIIK
jgi:hypothetical protein